MRPITKERRRDQPIPLRPHHIACIPGFRGEGYSLASIAGMEQFVALLMAHPETRVYLTRRGAQHHSADPICGACPGLQADAHCAVERLISRLDSNWEATLGVEAGHIYTWGELMDRVRNRASVADVAKNCGGCGWQSRGYCAEGLHQLGCR